MGIKDEVAAGHITGLRAMTDTYEWLGAHRVVVTGAGRAGSIGEAIVDELRVYQHAIVDEWPGDVRAEIEPGEFSECDAIVMCHGLQTMDWFEDADMEKVAEVIAVNLTGSYNVAQRFVLDTITTPKRKRIIMVGSMAHRNVLNGSAAYCASKAGLAMLARCMAWELTPKGFDVYCVHPSNVDGAPMANDTIEGLMRYRGLEREAAEQYWGASYIRNRSLTTEEIAELVHYLLNTATPYLSGNIELTGGQR